MEPNHTKAKTVVLIPSFYSPGIGNIVTGKYVGLSK
jgi:hypothetical protein